MPTLDTPLKLTISVTERCNLDCRHCYTDCNRRVAAELGTDDWLRFLDYLDENGFVHVFFEGGEPLLRPDIWTLMERCVPRMMTWLRTNGTMIDADVAARIAALGIGTVCVDLLGAKAPVHDSLTGSAGSFARATEGIAALRRLGVPVIMTLIVTRHAVGALDDYLRLAERLGVDRVGFLRLYPIGRARRNWQDLAPDLNETMAALERLDRPDGIHVMHSWHPADKNCCWQNAAVDALGKSIGCPYLREFVDYGNITEMPFLDTWQHPLYRRLRAGKVDGNCPDCHASQGTRGGCRATAYAFRGSWTAPDPFCSHLNRGVDLRVLPEWMLAEVPRPPGAPGR